ncbi:MAG: hypothetical protein GYA62_05210 [Bacteroidales bacterium]|nr:hypothetical protein [Bacteroidales bacterium]
MDKKEYSNLVNGITYTNQIQLSSQFKFCGNCFRADTYRGCDHGCKYCFANNRMACNFGGENNMQIGDHDKVANMFSKAFDFGGTTKSADLAIELMRRRVTMHLGGMSDPFQQRELRRELTLKFLGLASFYKYPLVISTKGVILMTMHLEQQERYLKCLNPRLHTFQISLIGKDEDWVRKFETGSPTPDERIKFIKWLKERGFWVSVRIQPLLNLRQAELVLDELYGIINYCTIEHLKLPKFNDKIWSSVLEHLPLEYKALLRSSEHKPEFELNARVKLDNIQYLKQKFPKLKFGCGDNDLHEYSDSLNCCGIDTMPMTEFSNWLKYNSMYIKMTGDRTQWVPESRINGLFLDDREKNKKGFKYRDFVEDYYRTIYEDDRQLSLFNTENK